MLSNRCCCREQPKNVVALHFWDCGAVGLAFLPIQQIATMYASDYVPPPDLDLLGNSFCK